MKKRESLKQIFEEALNNYKKKDFKNAENYCYKILNIDPNHFDSISLLATISAINRNFKKAKELILKAVEIEPNNLVALNNLGTAYKELGQLEKAVNTYKKVLTINPNHINANYNLGISFYALRNLKEAKIYLQKTTKIQNNYALAFQSLANVHVDLKELKEAKDCYQKAIEINPNLVGAHNNLGITFRDLNDLESAISCYQKAIKVRANNPSAHHNLGQAYKEIGEFDKSIKAHQMAIKYEPENLIHYQFLSELKKDILDSELKNKIKKIIENSKSTFINLAYGNFLLAKYERKDKNYEKELNYLKKAHQNFYNSQKEKFDLGNKYCFDDALKIEKEAHTETSNKKNDDEIKPIFIFGVPRCGSTLIERIIGSGQELIPVGEETGIIGHYIPSKILEKKSLNLGNLDNIRSELFDKYNQKKLISKKYGYRFTDKSLDNFYYLKLIRAIYPKAKLINCKRDVLSSIISIYQNNLANLAWCHDLNNIFKYFNNYFEIVEKYNQLYPNEIYELQFEKLVNNPEEESKKLMKYCELPWDKKCLEFYKRKDLFSKTASNIQIRQAIYKHSLDRYLPYKKFLEKYSKNYSWYK